MPRHRRDILWSVGMLTLAGLATGVTCLFAAGASLGLFLGPLAFAPAVIPQTSGRERLVLAGLAGTLAFCLAIVTTWVAGLALTGSGIQPGWITHGGLVLLAWLLMLQALTRVLIRRPRRRAGVVRAACVTLAAWLWFAWPVWLGPTLAETGADVPAWLTSLHPLLVMNAAVMELGIWTQQPLAYQLSPLGETIAYAFPETTWPFVVVHVGLSLVLLTLAHAKRLKARA